MSDIFTDSAVVTKGGSLLLCRAGGLTCGMPLEHVIETLRRTRVDAIPGAAAGTLGLMMIRGKPTPIVSLGHLLSGAANEAETRLVTLRAGTRVVALSVDEVLGVRSRSEAMSGDLPPLFEASASQLLEELGALDSSLFLVLRSSRLLSDDFWPARSES